MKAVITSSYRAAASPSSNAMSGFFGYRTRTLRGPCVDGRGVDLIRSTRLMNLPGSCLLRGTRESYAKYCWSARNGMGTPGLAPYLCHNIGAGHVIGCPCCSFSTKFRNLGIVETQNQTTS